MAIAAYGAAYLAILFSLLILHILEEFIRYLQEKPASRKLKYLAKETHDTICCFRCGYVYQERDVCPECGYKKNR